MRAVSLVLLLLILIRTGCFCQEIQEGNIYPEFTNSGMEIENRIQLDLTNMQQTYLLDTGGKKVVVKARNIVINGDTVKQDKITTRGQTTLLYKRKSLNIKLNSNVSFRHGENERSMNKFLLLNLAMDKYYCRNRLAFEMMDMLGIFDLYYSYCELEINGCSDGVYLILERPEDWAFEKKDAPVLIRRRGNKRMADIETGEKTDRLEKREYVDMYKQIYRVLDMYEGEDLYMMLDQYIDLDNYMKWLAFNFLVRNGDYTDEVFFYLDPEINKFRIIPWDYDDIFASTPHEGKEKRDKILGDKLVFSCEDQLDRKIAMDDYLYGIYLKNLEQVVEKLSPVILKQVLEDTYGELYPYYSNEEVISNAQFDHFNDASTEHLRNYLSSMFQLIVDTRNGCLKDLSSASQ